MDMKNLYTTTTTVTTSLEIYTIEEEQEEKTISYPETSAMSSVPKPPPGHFAVLYFASAGSHTGKEHESLPAPLPLSKLFAELDARYPGFTGKILDSCLVTVNLDYVDVGGDGDRTIQEGDEVAIIPPVSSG